MSWKFSARPDTRSPASLDIYSHEFERAKRSEDTRARIAATGIGAVLEGRSAQIHRRFEFLAAGVDDLPVDLASDLPDSDVWP
jgi:hypothetical protein